MNKEKLLKLLELSSSHNDSEALNAIRLANKYLEEHDMRWEQFVDSYISQRQNNINKAVLKECSAQERVLEYEKTYSKDLEIRVKGLKAMIKFLLVLIVVLIVIIILH